MDTTPTGDSNVPAVQECLLGSDEAAEAGQTEKEIKREKMLERRRLWNKNNAERKREGHQRWNESNRDRTLAYSKRYHQEHREQRLEASTRWRKENPERWKALQHKWYAANPEKVRERNRKAYWLNPEKNRQRIRDKRLSDPEKWNRQRRAQRVRLRLEAFQAYGGAYCKCCGDSVFEFLSIDHVNNDGSVHRKEVACGALPAWLKKRGYPSGFQILCYDCNMAKAFYGSCPHTQMKTPIDLFFEP